MFEPTMFILFKTFLFQFYSAAATPNVAEVEDRVHKETRSRNPPRGWSDSLDKILHSISLNVQVRIEG